MDSYPFCSIVIPALNEEEFIEQCLLSLNHQTYPRDRYEIIVVDNGSNDSTKSIAEQHADRVLEKLDVNVGAVRNHGALHAKGEILICTDSDCLSDRNWIESGVNLLINNPDHVFGGGLKSGDHPTWVEKYWLLNDHGENTKQQRDLMGSCIFLWKQVFEQVGGFREDVTSGEDTELSKSLKSYGSVVVIDKSLSIVHMGNAKTIRDFSKRQIWHAENYIKNIRQSLRDPLFYLATTFLIMLGLSAFVFFANPALSGGLLVLTLLMPSVLTVKRISRANLNITYCLKAIPLIYALDLFYLTGRSFGLVKGLIGYRQV